MQTMCFSIIRYELICSREINLHNGTIIIANETRFEDGSLLSVYTDITDLKNKEADYKQLAEALDNLPIPMLFWDKDDKLILFLL